MAQPTYEQLLEFAQLAARLLMDGDLIDNGDGHYREWMEDGNDDNVSALYELIQSARDLTGVVPDVLVTADQIEERGLAECHA